MHYCFFKLYIFDHYVPNIEFYAPQKRLLCRFNITGELPLFHIEY